MRRRGYGSCSVCVSVIMKSAAYLVYTSKTRPVSWGSLWFFQDICCAAFAENASFKSSGVICQSPLPSSFPDELPMDKTDSAASFQHEECVQLATAPTTQLTHH